MFSLKSTSSIKDYILKLNHAWSDDPTVISKLKILQKREALHDERLLWNAARYGLPAHLEIFIQAGCDVYSEDIGIIGWAVSQGNLTTMRYLLRSGVSVHSALSKLPEHFNREEIDKLIDELIEAGGNLERDRSMLYDPLNSAIFSSKTVVVSAMLDRGLSPEYDSGFGNSWSAMSISALSSEFGKFRYSKEELERRLIAAVDIMKMLANAGLPLNNGFYHELDRSMKRENSEYLTRLKSIALNIEPIAEQK